MRELTIREAVTDDGDTVYYLLGGPKDTSRYCSITFDPENEPGWAVILHAPRGDSAEQAVVSEEKTGATQKCLANMFKFMLGKRTSR